MHPEQSAARGEAERKAIEEGNQESLDAAFLQKKEALENARRSSAVTRTIADIDFSHYVTPECEHIRKEAGELPPDEMKSAVIRGLLNSLNKNSWGAMGGFSAVAAFFGVHDIGAETDENRAMLLLALQSFLGEQHNVYDEDGVKVKDARLDFDAAIKALKVSPEERNHVITKTVLAMITKGNVEAITEFAETYSLPGEFFSTPEAIAAAKKGVTSLLENVWGLPSFLALFPEKQAIIDDPAVRQAAEVAFAKASADSYKPEVVTLKEIFGFEVDQASPVSIYFDQAVPRAVREAYETYPVSTYNTALFNQTHQRARLTHALSPAEYARLLELRPELASAALPQEAAFDALQEHLDLGTGEVPGIADSMDVFAWVFGKEATMRFANRPDLSRHDAYMAGKNLLWFMTAQHFDPKNETESAQFRARFANVLAQVAQDDAQYPGVGTAHHKFNEVMSALESLAIDEMLAKIESGSNAALKKRAEKLRTERFDPLGSWKGLKDAAELATLYQQQEMAGSFSEAEVPEAVKEYADALMAHPNISLPALRQFLTRPKAFLEAEGMYVDAGLQTSLSPARMLDVERLGLTATEIRDALVDGTMDSLQLLPPEEAEYTFDAEGNDIETAGHLQRAFGRAIGRQKEGVKGEAQDPKALFADLTKWAKGRGFSKAQCISWLRGEERLALQDSDLADLVKILHAPANGIPEAEGIHVRVRVGKKSDPTMMVAGNDTASCMPFGDGKTNVYAWNPNCAQLVVERKTADGEWRTMAQSVLMLEVDVKKSAADAIRDLRGGKRVDETLDAAVFAASPKLVCDNIEPAPNDVAEGRMSVIEKAYVKFFGAYMAKHAAALGADPAEVIIGKEGYETNRRPWSFPQVDNTFLPLAPVSYTDNTGPKAYRLVTGAERSDTARKPEISSVTAADVLPMAFLEGKSFADNPNLVFGLYDRQHKIVGASIARLQHGDPDLCIMSRDKDGLPVGYMIAYVDRTTTVPEVFIDDMAVDRSRNLLAAKHAARLLDVFLKRYASHYSRSDAPFPPIYAQMRESTSYRLFTRQAEKLSKEHGLRIEIDEQGETDLGGEKFKLVRVFVGKTQEGLAAAKNAFLDRQTVGRVDEERPDEHFSDEDQNQSDFDDSDGT